MSPRTRRDGRCCRHLWEPPGATLLLCLLQPEPGQPEGQCLLSHIFCLVPSKMLSFIPTKQVFAETPSLSSLPFWFVSCSFLTVYHTVQFIGKKHRTEHRQKVNMQRTHVKYFNLERIATDNLMDIGPLRDPFSGCGGATSAPARERARLARKACEVPGPLLGARGAGTSGLSGFG